MTLLEITLLYALGVESIVVSLFYRRKFRILNANLRRAEEMEIFLRERTEEYFEMKRRYEQIVPMNMG